MEHDRSPASWDYCLFTESKKAVFFELFDQREVDEMFRFRQRLFARVLVLDHELNGFERWTRRLLQSRRIVLPGSFQRSSSLILPYLPRTFLLNSLSVR